MTGFDAGHLLGPIGGQLALAFGTGCAAGYAFCLRTVYKMLLSHKDLAHQTCIDRIEKLEREKDGLQERMKTLEDRWYMGSNRQMAQISESSIRILGEDKLGLAMTKKDKSDGT